MRKKSPRANFVFECCKEIVDHRKMSSEEITDVQPGEQTENGQGEAPAAAVQLDQQQQQVAKEVSF